MKMAILGTRGIPAEYGGFETFAQELSARLVRDNIDVTVYCKKVDSHAESQYKGVKLKYIKSPRLGPFTSLFYDLICILKALKNHDLIYMLGYGAGLFFWLPRIIRKPLWVNMDGLEWKRSKWPWYGKIYLRVNEWLAVKFAGLIIADAEQIKTYLVAKYGNNINCRMISYGAEVVSVPPDINLIQQCGLKPYDYYLVVCRLEPENNIKEIIKGFIRSSTSKKLIVIGSPKKKTRYARSILRADDTRVKLMGSIYNRELLKAIRYYSFTYIHGHSVGGTNPSLLEALGCGNPIIAHDNLFNREVAGNNAVYFSTPEQITDIIVSSKSTIGASNPARAMERIQKNYSWDSVADKYLKLLQDFKT